MENPEPAAEQQKQELEPRFKKLQDKLDNESITYYEKQFDQMVHSPEWSIDGYTFHYQVQSFKRIQARKELEKEDIDENKDLIKYADNYFKQGLLLIKEGELTEEIFEIIDFYEFENIVSAWRVRSRRGFPKDQQSL